MHAEMGLFSSVNAYNSATTTEATIYQFAKNVHLISPAISVIYKIVKI